MKPKTTARLAEPTDQSESLSVVHFMFSLRLETGGVVRAVLDVCEALASRGHRVTLLTCDATDAPDTWRAGESGVPHVVELKRSSIPTRLLSRRGLRDARAIFAQADVVHLHALWSLSNIQLSRAARSLRKPLVVTVHGMLDRWSMEQSRLKKRVFLALCGRRFLESAAIVHFTADREREQSIRWIPGANRHTRVVPCLFDLAPYRQMPGPDLARQAFPALTRPGAKILYLSRLHPVKGIDLLIEAAAVLRRRNLPLQLLIAGPGEDDYRKSLESQVTRLGISDRTHFLGMVSGPEKISLYQAADVFVLPTKQESFGIVLVEALASGAPVITTKGTDIWGEIEKAGGLIVPRQAEPLADAMEKILRDEQLRTSLGKQGRDYVFEWLAHDRVAGQYEQLYADALARR